MTFQDLRKGQRLREYALYVDIIPGVGKIHPDPGPSHCVSDELMFLKKLGREVEEVNFADGQFFPWFCPSPGDF